MTAVSLTQSIVLGIVQGLGEFLPISSSAHLALIPSYFHWSDPGLAFDVALHLGTLVAVVSYYWTDLWKYAEACLYYQDPARHADRTLVGYLLLATVPGAIAGLLLEHKIETLFRSPHLIAINLIVLGTLLGIADRFRSGNRALTSITATTALWLGLSQSLALLPGVSRSGITITMALFMGFERKEAARFSFLMSIPIIAGAGLLKFKEILRSPDLVALAFGFAAAALSGYVAITVLLRYVQKNRYTPFVLYRWALGAFILFNLSHFA